MTDTADVIRIAVLGLAGFLVLLHFKNKQAVAIANTPLPILREIIRIENDPGLKTEVIETEFEPVLGGMSAALPGRHLARFSGI